MADKVSDFLLERLRQWRVHRIFGFPGDGINGILAALDRAQGDPEFVQVRHEEMAAFMACGHAKFTGEVGVCMATSGPGAVHLLNGLYDARLDHQPLLAIVGQQPRTSIGGSFQQELDIHTLYKDVAGEYVNVITAAEQLPGAIDRAIRIAKTQRTVTCLIFPKDVQDMKAVKQPPHEFHMYTGSVGYAPPRILPSAEALRRAADVLNAGKRLAMLIGQGAKGAAAEVLEIADLLGAGIAKALLGKDVVPDTLPFVTGSIGLLGTRPSWDMMNECDTLFMVGSSFPYAQFMPPFGQARGVQIDIDGRMIGIRYPMEVNLIGDSRETLQALIPFIHRKEDRSWRQRLEEGVGKWWELVEARAMLHADPINPQRIYWELNSYLPDNCIIAGDCGSNTDWFGRDVKLREGMMSSLSGTLATMGCGTPYAIAAKFAHPDRPVLALIGDGAAQMNGMNEWLTIAKYWKRWADPRLVIHVLHNNDLNQVTWELRVMEGNPKFETSQNIPDFDYAAYARLVGLHGIRVERPDEVANAWQEAFAADRPTVIDTLASGSVPPLPPHISMEESMKMLQTMLKGDPNELDLVRQSFNNVFAQYVPGDGI